MALRSAFYAIRFLRIGQWEVGKERVSTDPVVKKCLTLLATQVAWTEGFGMLYKTRFQMDAWANDLWNLRLAVVLLVALSACAAPGQGTKAKKTRR